MIDDISNMIELQKLWDSVMRAEKEIASATLEVSSMEKEIESRNSKYAELKGRLKTLKSALNRKEIELGQLAQKENDLSVKRSSAANEKQLKAFDSEIESIRATKNTLEEETLLEMNDLENLEAECADMKRSMPGEIEECNKNIEMMKGRISRFKDISSEKRKELDEGTSILSAQVRSKFLKLLNSSNKQAIVAVEKNICSGCRNVLPVNDLNDLGDNIKLVSCQNCGKYIYREN